MFALLIDPDKYTEAKLCKVLDLAKNSPIDFVFVGGSLISMDVEQTICFIKGRIQVPVIIFPGSLLQISPKADGILFLSLISGRNPDLLIGNHVIAATKIRKSNLEVLSTGYILIDGGRTTSVEYMSNTKPIPADKPDIAIATAIAGEMLGHKLIYLEAGSGARNQVNLDVIAGVRKHINIPLIVGGGINSAQKAKEAFDVGADIIVVGNSIENELDSLRAIAQAVF